MRRLVGRLVIGVASVLVVSTPVVVTTAQAAPVEAVSTCVPPDNPAPRVLSFTATDVVPGSDSIRGYAEQRFTARADNPCGQVDCEAGKTCTSLQVAGRRTAGSGAGCVFHSYDEPTARPEADGTSTYEDVMPWTDNDANDDLDSPTLNNKCAGAYDVSVTVANGYYDAATGKYASASSAPFLQTRSFTVRRPARLRAANASPEPVRVGRTVTVTGRLTRANWDVYRNPMQGYAGQRVLVQRRTATGAYNTLKSVRTDRRGYLHTGIKALSGTRCYRWVFPENTTTEGRTSGGDCVRAR